MPIQELSTGTHGDGQMLVGRFCSTQMKLSALSVDEGVAPLVQIPG